MKRHRFSSPLSSDLEPVTGEESDYSSYTPSKAHKHFKGSVRFFPLDQFWGRYKR